MKHKAIIVDIDGTLADITHRRHFVEGEKKDWKSFNGAMAEDKLNLWCAELVETMYRQGYCIIFVTGRHAEYKQLTDAFIKKHIFPYQRYWKLFTRNSGDYRKDTIVKQEIYEGDIEPYYDVLFAIDDRQSVVDMWRSIGLTCLQCDKGDF